MLCIGPQVCAIARPTGRCKHRPLRSTGQGSAGLCRISPSARRQCTPQSAPCGASSSPYRGAFQAAAPRKASPARGGAAAGGGGVRRLALPLPFRTAAACVGGRCFASARKFAPSQGPKGRCKHRPLRSTGQGSARLCRISPSARRQCTPQSAPCGASSSPYRGAFQAAAPRKASPAREGAAAAQKQPRTGALGAGLFCRDAGGPFGGQRPADSGVSVSETAASGVAGGASASSPRRHSRCSSSGICSAAQVPSSCCVISSSISS